MLLDWEDSVVGTGGMSFVLFVCFVCVCVFWTVEGADGVGSMRERRALGWR